MTDFAWPQFPVTRFQMRIESVTKIFASPYSNQVQVADMMSECWKVQMDLAPDISLAMGTAIEAFFDRLKGAANRILLSNLRVRVNQGTMRGAPTLSASAAQLANTLTISTTPGATAMPGDMLGCGGQLFRVLAPAVANGSGVLVVEVGPRVRAAGGISSGTAVVWSQPTAPFRLASANPAVDWRPGEFSAPSVELREDVS